MTDKVYEAEMADFASLMVDETIATIRVQLVAGEGLAVSDQLAVVDQLIRERNRDTATQPATSQEGEGLSDRQCLNTILAKHFASYIPDVIERIRVGNAACTEILATFLAATPTPPTLSEDLREARPMSDEAKTGERVLVHFAGKGWITVSWEDPDGDGDYPIWCVDDDKHGPYSLRGYREGDDTHWMPLPTAPAALAQVKAS